jgi:hypothetical protein
MALSFNRHQKELSEVVALTETCHSTYIIHFGHEFFLTNRSYALYIVKSKEFQYSSVEEVTWKTKGGYTL